MLKGVISSIVIKGAGVLSLLENNQKTTKKQILTNLHTKKQFFIHLKNNLRDNFILFYF